MNQILFTGDDNIGKNQNFEKKPKKQKQEKKPKQQKQQFSSNNYNNHKEKKVIPINKIVIFFAIAVIVLGICLVGGSIYVKNQINAEVDASATPVVEINQNDDNNTIEITVTHIRGITQITYQWNDEEEHVIEENNQTTVYEEIDLIGGVNTLTVTVTEENGQTVKYQKEYSVGNIPEIELENVDNGVKITAYAEDVIDYITYSWDDEDETTIEVGEEEYEGVISAPKGRHTLTIVVVDEEGIPAKKTTTVIGATAPEISVQLGRKGDDIYFVISVTDEEELENVTITLNEEVVVIEDVNDATYYVELRMEDGENRLIVKAENNNGLTSTEKKAFDTSSLD